MKKISKLIVFVAVLTFAVFSQSEVLRLNYNGGNQDIALAPGSKVNVVSSDGRVEVTTNLTAVQIGDLLGVTGTINNPSVNISVANSVLTSGTGTTTLSWTIADATSCNKTGEWGTGSLATVNGNQSIGPFTGPATKTYGITCQNSLGATASDTVNVTITDPNGVNCAIDQPPILNGAEDLTIIANSSASANPYNGKYSNWQGGSSNNPWPRFSTDFHLSLTRNSYIASEFITETITNEGKLVFSPPGFPEGNSSNNVTISISECPGDFTTHLGQAKCLLLAGPGPEFKWSNSSASSSATFCKLEKGKKYYLNIVHSIDTANGYQASACSSSYCGMIPANIKLNN